LPTEITIGNPRGSYRYTHAHFVVFGFSLVVCFIALVACLSASLHPLPEGYHYENFREDSELVGHDIDRENYDLYAEQIARAKEARRVGHY
jgi:hypothetical protein